MLRKLITPLFAFFILLTGLFLPQEALAEEIADYQVDIKVNKSSEINIVETIRYDFGLLDRHGIFRNIPYITINKEGKKYQLEIDVSDVSYGNGQDVPYSISTENEDKIIKIGDPNKTITGVNTYVISYTVKGAVTYFSDHDELYWDAIGTGWEIPIYNTEVNLDLTDFPEVKFTSENFICFSGIEGSTAQDCEILINPDNTVNISSSTVLMPNQGLTFALSFPQGTLERYEPAEYKASMVGFWFLLMGFLLNVFLSLGIVILWFFKGRDSKDNRVIVRMYDAPKDTRGKEMTPLELGTMFDESISAKDLSGEIINLAIRKYLIIKEDDDKKVSLEQGPKLKEDLTMSGLKPHQQDLIRAFDLHTKESINISDKTKSATRATKIEKIKSDLYKDLTEQGYFKSNPQSLRLKYFIAAFILFFVGLMIPGVLVALFAYFMPAKTQLGVEAKRHALGLKQFLDSQERQFEFQEKNFYLFEKLLPYAIAFNVAKVWAKRFEDLYGYRPDWYQSPNINNFTTYNIINSLERDLGTVESNYSTPTTSSTGHSSGFSGGSSGGGGGGGGGGSW